MQYINMHHLFKEVSLLCLLKERRQEEQITSQPAANNNRAPRTGVSNAILKFIY